MNELAPADIDGADIPTVDDYAPIEPDPPTESNPNNRAGRRRALRMQAREAAAGRYVQHEAASRQRGGLQLQLMNREQRRIRGVRVPFERL